MAKATTQHKAAPRKSRGASPSKAGKIASTPEPATTVFRPVLGEYFAFEVLWKSTDPAAIFNSEGAARWFFRNHRSRLSEAKAAAIHTGRVLVHPQRFAEVAEAVALQNAADRALAGDSQ